jgi:hypothetical protein
MEKGNENPSGTETAKEGVSGTQEKKTGGEQSGTVTKSIDPIVIANELQEARQEAAKFRTELREIQRKTEEEAKKTAEEQGKFKELYTQTSTEMQTLKQENEALKAEVDVYRKEKEQKKKTLLSNLPDDMKALFKDGTIEQIEAVLQKLKPVDNANSLYGNQNGKPPEKAIPKTFEDLVKQQYL